MTNKSIQLFLICLVASTGCTSWQPNVLSRPIPIELTRNPRSTQLQERLTSKTNDPLSPSRSATPTSTEQKKDSTPNNQLRSDFKLAEWPDSQHWDAVYAQINAADQREAKLDFPLGSQREHPLRPKSKVVRVEPEEPWEQMQWSLNRAALLNRPAPTATASEPDQSIVATNSSAENAAAIVSTPNQNETPSSTLSTDDVAQTVELVAAETVNANLANLNAQAETENLDNNPAFLIAGSITTTTSTDQQTETSNDQDFELANHQNIIGSGVAPASADGQLLSKTAALGSENLTLAFTETSSTARPAFGDLQTLGLLPSVDPSSAATSPNNPSSPCTSSGLAGFPFGSAMAFNAFQSAMKVHDQQGIHAPFSNTTDAATMHDAAVTKASFEAPNSDHLIPSDSSLAQTLARLREQVDRELMGDRLPASRRRALELSRQLLVLSEEPESTQQHEMTDAFWAHQVRAIATMLERRDEATAVSFGDHALASLEHLRQAERELEAVASLRIANPVFCYEVNGFGQYRGWDQNSFETGQQLLLYCELNNHQSEPTVRDNASVYATRLRNSLVICDADNRVVQQVTYPEVEDLARSRRRDFYLYVPLTIGDLKPGTYSVYLTVSDTVGNKTTTLDPPLKMNVR